MKLVRVTHSFYQERPFVNIQPTNISSISQRREPSQREPFNGVWLTEEVPAEYIIFPGDCASSIE